MNAKKLSASLPGDQYGQIERARRKLRLNRSQVVQEALTLWLSAHDRDDRVARYLAGYVRHPEDAADATAFAETWAQGLMREDW